MNGWKELAIRLLEAATVLFLGVALFMAASSRASAHDWYPSECCSDGDCAPVGAADVAPVPGTPGMLRVTTTTRKYGTLTGFVTEKTRRLSSQDGRSHACLRPFASWDSAEDRALGGAYVRCFFEPPGI